jgi:hypothetical protein
MKAHIGDSSENHQERFGNWRCGSPKIHYTVDNRGKDMKLATNQRMVAPVLGIFILVAAIWLTGCVANYSHTQVPPDAATNVLHVGDEVEITRKDDSTAYFKIKEIDDAEVSGSLLTSMVGRDVSIPFSDIAVIKLYTKEGYDAEQTFEAWSYLLILWPFFL